MNFRERFIQEDISICEEYWEHLSWEEQQTVRRCKSGNLDRYQFNKLQGIAERIRNFGFEGI